MRPLILVFLVIFLHNFSQAQQQTMACVESESIVQAMPEYKQAQNELLAYTKQLEKTLEEKKEAYEKEYAAVIDTMQRGLMSPAWQKKTEARLLKMQQEIQQEAFLAEQKIVQKERDLIEPLYQKLKKALEETAQAEGYVYIVEKQFMLYSLGGINATDKVKARLGI